MTPMGRAFLQVQVAFAEMERSVIHQRVKEGIAARTVGRKRGRPRLMTPERLRHAQHLMADRNRSIPAICRELGGVPASTLYYYLRADGTLNAPGVALLGTDTPPVGNPPRHPEPMPEILLIFARRFWFSDGGLSILERSMANISKTDS
jgi:Resolvase, N terminal domain